MDSASRDVDGCSGGVSLLYRLVWGVPPVWEWCCDEHDVAYAEGGDSAARALADARLRTCMAEAGHSVRAWIYWCAVRLLGWRYWTWG